MYMYKIGAKSACKMADTVQFTGFCHTCALEILLLLLTYLHTYPCPGAMPLAAHHVLCPRGSIHERS